ncbi:MAG: RNA polymerase sigma factor region1.1 domain-containing protein, partial [Verrucomicrobiota bacterium]|nr:RNA polymerase sigma factor region1.1 domain-containing protein [Verrucomicrobiota bacterium]
MPTTKANKSSPKKKAVKAKPAKKAAVEKKTIASVKKTSGAKASPARKTTTAKATVKKVAKKSVKAKPSVKASRASVSSSKEAAMKVKVDAEPHALDDEVTEKVRQLIHLSREQGFLTYKDVDKSLPEIAEKPEELQNVISIFNNLEIKLLDSREVEKYKKKKEENEE